MKKEKVQDKFKIFMFLVLLILSSCKEDIKKKTLNKKENKMLEKILEDQLLGGNSSDYQIYNYSEKDLNVIIPIEKKELIANGFKSIDNEIFNKKIKSIFGRTIDYSLESKYLYVNIIDKCDRKVIWNLNNTIDYNGLFIVKNENFISDLYAIPELIDYEKDYPNVSKVEEKPIQIKDEIEEKNIEVEHWKDDKNLMQVRTKNIQILINRNKYLFNDNKASFVWLRFNDEQFLQSLVKTFGYVEDEQLNKFVLDKNLKDDEEFGKVIWSKDCSRKIKFNLNIFEIIKKESKKEQEKYLEAINNYLGYFIRTQDNYLNLTFSEKAEISGKLAYYATKLVGSESHDYYKFFPVVAGEEYQKEFEKQKYYNIKDFKTIYEETKTGGTWYPGMPE
jgi:hypothetical protein